MRGLAWLVVAAASAVSGGFSIPIGFALGLPVLEVYIAATLGSIVSLTIFLMAGDRIRSKLAGGTEATPPDPNSRVRRLVDRYGARGLGLIGPIFPGVTASVVLGLTLGLGKGELARWLSLGTAIMFALYCGGLWLLITAIGVE
ncbi:MAG: hypothetical protein ACR2QE_19800 [Acidimicrobiales bacterium]